jgi:hypothetical protein
MDIFSKFPFNVLQAIDVSRCNCVSSSGLLSVISGHKGLEQMDARYCLSVSLNLKCWCIYLIPYPILL